MPAIDRNGGLLKKPKTIGTSGFKKSAFVLEYQMYEAEVTIN